MNSLWNVTSQELIDELERRKNVESGDVKPTRIAMPFWMPLYMICQQYIDSCEKNNHVDEDLEHYIFEAAMEAVFGPDVWKYVNKHYDG